jgi:SPP1 family predicted phage head-tail adaptor
MAHRLPTSIQPGDLRHRIQIVRPSGSQDGWGGVSQDPAQWTPIRTCWASIEAWTGSQSLAAGQFTSETSHWVVIRHPRDTAQTPDAGCYVWWNGRTFIVEAVLNPTEQTKLLVLVCAEINDSRQQVPTPIAT